MTKPSVAFVVQRCGREVNGGAELLALEIAREMAARWSVTIVTTTARDYLTWEPYYQPGEDLLDGVRVLRFSVDRPRDTRRFNRLSERIVPRLQQASLAEQEAWMRAQGPYSSDLLHHLEHHGSSYDAVIFVTYLYATTYFGLPLVEDRAILAPLAHDEWPMYLPMWDAFFARPRRFVLNTPEEREFLGRRFPHVHFRGPTVGVGIRPPDDVRPDRFRKRFGIANPYAIYVGRIDPAKGCEQLLRDFARYKELHQDDLLLVMLGREAMPLPPQPHLRAVGFVDDQTKYDAIAGAEFLIVPSGLESLSIVLLESWSQHRPTLSNAASDVLVGQSRRAGAGLWYTDSAEFVAAIPFLRDPAIAGALGERGARFVRETYGWDTIVRAYESVLADVLAERNAAAPV